MDAPDYSVKFIDHLVLRTGDVERLAGFYQDVVGLKIERQTASGMTQLRAGQCLLDIVPVDDRDLPGRNLEHFWFRVDPFDVEAIRGRLEADGAPVIKAGTAYGAKGHPVHGPHHDTEFGRPVDRDDVLFERIALEINQAGLSWLLVLRKRAALHAAFEGFDPMIVARYGAPE